MVSLEYLAGYFDGEGCVCIQVPRASREGHAPTLRASLQTADKEILEEFVQLFGGKLIPRKSGKVKRALYSWSVGGVKAQDMLSQLLPFLIGKAEVARLGLQMKFGPSGHWIPKEEYDKRVELAKAVSAINQRVTVH